MIAMRVYIAAPWPIRDAAQAFAEALGSRPGIEIVSRWLYVDESLAGNEGARMDLEDLDAVDAFVLYNQAEWTQKGGGGRHTEFGYALAKGKRLFVYGKASNVFHDLPQVTICLTYDALVKALTGAA